MVSVAAVLIVAPHYCQGDGGPAQSYCKSIFIVIIIAINRLDTSSVLYIWLCRLSRNLLRTLKGHKGMNTSPLTEPLSLYLNYLLTE